jgi:hypothetical protein
MNAAAVSAPENSAGSISCQQSYVRSFREDVHGSGDIRSRGRDIAVVAGARASPAAHPRAGRLSSIRSGRVDVDLVGRVTAGDSRLHCWRADPFALEGVALGVDVRCMDHS